MNAEMMLHLVSKDLRLRQGSVIKLWVLLAVYVCIPLLRAHVNSTESLQLLDFLVTLAATCQFITLQTDFIHADHPLATDAFLHTRPVGGSTFVTAKLLAWLGAAVLPALTAILLRLAMHRLDLRASDYLRVGLRDTLLIIGPCGLLAMIAAVIPMRRLALSVCVLAWLLVGMAYSTIHDTLWDNLSESGLEYWVDEKSRLAAMWAFILGSGYVLAGSLLARVKTGTTLLLMLAAGLVCAGVRFAWPANIVWRNERVVVHDGARLHDVQRALQLSLAKEVKVRRGSGPLRQEGGVEYYKHGPSCMALLTLQGMDGLEWPEVTGYWASMRFGESWKRWHIAAGPYGVENVKLARGAVERARSAMDFEIATAMARNVMPPEAVMKALSLPTAMVPVMNRRLVESGRHLPPREQPLIFFNHQGIPIWAAEQPPENLQAHLEGQLSVRWLRPVVLAVLPLKNGVRFAHDGHSVLIRSAGLVGNGLHLRLSLDRCESMLGTWSGKPFDANPRLTLCVANPAAGEIAVPTFSREQGGGLMTLLDLHCRDIEAHYVIVDTVSKGTPSMSPEWLAGARLYVLEKQEFGSSASPLNGLPFKGEAVTRWER